MRFILLFLIFVFDFLNAQNLTLIYELKYKPNLKKDYITENYFLDILKNKSVFRSERTRKSDSLVAKTGLGLGGATNFNNQFDVSKDYSKNEVRKIVVSPLFREVYFLKPDTLNWEILPMKESVKIGEFNCQSAETNYGGRRWKAWFTAEIPIADGPYIFGQLPGMIIKISDENSEFNFELVKLLKNNWSDLYEKKNGKLISWQTFQKLQTNYYESPFSEAKSRNVPLAKDDGYGNPVRMNAGDFKIMEDHIRHEIRENYNPLERNYSVEYK